VGKAPKARAHAGLRHCEERSSRVRSTGPRIGAEIEVPPEMVEAGIKVLPDYECFFSLGPTGEIVGGGYSQGRLRGRFGRAFSRAYIASKSRLTSRMWLTMCSRLARVGSRFLCNNFISSVLISHHCSTGAVFAPPYCRYMSDFNRRIVGQFIAKRQMFLSHFINVVPLFQASFA
jgi:hypothetical protein